VAEHKARLLWRVDDEGRGPQPVEARTTIECFDLSPDGGALAYSDWGHEPGETSLALLDLRTGAVRQLGQGLCPAFSPDGRSVAFFGSEPGSPGLFTLELDTGLRRLVAAEAARGGFLETNLGRRPAWLRDGGAVVFPALGPTPAPGLWRVDRDGRQTLLATGNFTTTSASPDGRLLAVLGASEAGRGLHVVDLEAGTTRRLVDASPFVRAAPVWSRDGESVSILVDPARDPKLRTFDLEGNESTPAVRLERVPDPSFWGVFDLVPWPDGGFLYLAERYEGDVYLLRPRG
jgi:Tol biopolymer transport system component